MEDIADFGAGVADLARAWVSDLKYYTVQPEKYRHEVAEERVGITDLASVWVFDLKYYTVQPEKYRHEVAEAEKTGSSRMVEGAGVADLASAWVSELKYYTVQPEKYCNEVATESEGEFGDGGGVSEDAEIGVSMEGDGAAAPPLNRMPTGRRAASRRFGASTIERRESGVSNSSTSSMKYSRQQIANSYMEEHLQSELKQSPLPGIFYTAGLAPAILNAVGMNRSRPLSRQSNGSDGRSSATGRTGSIRRNNRRSTDGTEVERQKSGLARAASRAQRAMASQPTIRTIPEEESALLAEDSVDGLSPSGVNPVFSPEGGEDGGTTATGQLSPDGNVQGADTWVPGQLGSNAGSAYPSSNALAAMGEQGDVLSELPVFPADPNAPGLFPGAFAPNLSSSPESSVDPSSEEESSFSNRPYEVPSTTLPYEAPSTTLPYESPFSAFSTATFQNDSTSPHAPKPKFKHIGGVPAMSSKRFGPMPSKRMSTALPVALSHLGNMPSGETGSGQGREGKMMDMQQNVDAAANIAMDQNVDAAANIAMDQNVDAAANIAMDQVGDEELERNRVMALYEAAVIADQNVKLSVFTTRPAIYSPPFNWLCEFMSTVTIILGVNLLVKQVSLEGQPGAALQPFYVGLFICLLILGLGGPTGLSVNPARDLGPRLAHWLLPIPNKGPSEWDYGWIPPTAAIAGGAAGAALFIAIRLLDEEP
eukprot:gene3197-13216_t